jgi:serine/threonine-protein kinase
MVMDRLQAALASSYRIERELGGGGMSRVFVATEIALDRKVVIKVLPPEMAAGVNVERFRREIQLAASLQHPHIVPLHAAGQAGDLFYYTMPLVEGETLRARIARESEMPVADAVRFLRDVADALAHAHSHGVVHRDIKPDNVLISGRHALVTDFGVAKAISESTGQSSLTSAGLALGTPAYMAPEQAAADPHVDHRADIYAVGALAYEVLSGRPPFIGPSPQTVLAAHVTQAAEPISSRRPACPPALAALVMRCLEKKPADRWQSAEELVRQLELMATPSGGLAPTTAVPAAKRPRLGRVWIAGIAAAAVLTAGAWLLRSRAAASSSAAGRSIAVLPLANVGGDAQQEYFSDGMTDELASALGRIPGLRVASRTSSYAFKGKTTDVGQIGRALNVETVLEGTVRRAGERLRVSVQLTKVSDGLALWSETYERPTADVFQVQDDVAKSVVSALSPTLGPHQAAAEVAGIATRGTDNLQAYDLYLRGQHLWHSRRLDGLRQAVNHFTQAVTLDPNFARAYGWLALTWVLLPSYGNAQFIETVPKAQEAAGRALALDSTVAEARVALASANLQLGRYAEAERAFRDAIRVAPRYPTAHHWYGTLLWTVGRTQESVEQYSMARDLDPLSPIISANLGIALARLGRRDEAIASAHRAIELAPSVIAMHTNAAVMWEYLGEADSSLAAYRVATGLEPDSPLGFTNFGGYALKQRRFGEALTAGDSVIARFPHLPGGYLLRAWALLASRGDQSAARGTLEVMRDSVRQLPTEAYLMFQLAGGEYAGRFARLTLAEVNALSRADTIAFYGAKALWAHGEGDAAGKRTSLEALRSVLEGSGGSDFVESVRLPASVIVHAGLGQRVQAERALDTLLAFARKSESEQDRGTAGDMAYAAAVGYTLLGDPGNAAAQLGRWLTLPTGGTLALARIDPALATIRDTPEFQRLAASR